MKKIVYFTKKRYILVFLNQSIENSLHEQFLNIMNNEINIAFCLCGSAYELSSLTDSTFHVSRFLVSFRAHAEMILKFDILEII